MPSKPSLIAYFCYKINRCSAHSSFEPLGGAAQSNITFAKIIQDAGVGDLHAPLIIDCERSIAEFGRRLGAATVLIVPDHRHPAYELLFAGPDQIWFFAM